MNLWLYCPCGPWLSLGLVINRSQGRYLHTQQDKDRINAHTNIHVSSGILTHDPNVPAGEGGSWFRPCGHCDRQYHVSVC
jgi:hypothetical protein